MKVTASKSHLQISGNSRATVTIDNSFIESEDEQVLLRIPINPTFENHINSISRKVSQKLNAHAKTTRHINIKKQRTIMKSFATSQFSYCLLIWMFYSRRLNIKINSIHERAPGIKYQRIRQHFKDG